jgi:serine/threonine-protein kinase
VEGRPLSDVAARLPVSAKVELLRQTASGLHAAHLQGLVHRDVKPGNVLVEEGPGGARSAFLTDFGLARAEDAALSRTGLAPGTLDYMSPEQLVGPGPVDCRADVYSLGATLYALLAGRPPFRRADPSEEEERQVLRRIVEEDPLPLSKVSPQAPRDLDLIAARAMEKDPAARYPSAEAFAQDLDRFQRGEPILARRPGLSRRVARWTQRNRALARAFAVAAAALVVALGWTLWSARRSGLLALEAARLGAQAESMEDQQRMERLSPAHDLRPAKGKLRAEVEALRPQAGRGGPASFALGKGLELLGDVEGARAAYEQAWSAGFRTPRVAEGLGTVLALLYRQKYERARETLEPAAREERLAALRAELREPAKQYLARGDAAGWRGALLRASIAMLEGDYATTRARAEEALALDPGRYEARGLIAESWLEESRQLAADQRLDEADAAATRAAAPLEEALRWGRSDLGLVENRAQIHRYRADLAARRGQSPDQELGAMLSALDQARALDPDDPSLLVLRGIALVQKVQYSFLAGAADVLPLLDQAADAYRQAMAIDPRDQKTLCLLGMCLYYRAFRLNETGRDALPTAKEGLAALQRAAALAPKDPEVRAVSFLLRSSRPPPWRWPGSPRRTPGASRSPKRRRRCGSRPTGSSSGRSWARSGSSWRGRTGSRGRTRARSWSRDCGSWRTDTAPSPDSPRSPASSPPASPTRPTC